MAADNDVSVEEARQRVTETVADAQRTIAERAAEQEALDRRAAEVQAAEARLAAAQNQAAAQRSASERRYLWSQLKVAREESANAAFGKYLLLGIIVALIIVGAIAYRFRPQSPNPAYAAPPPPGSTAVTVTR